MRIMLLFCILALVSLGRAGEVVNAVSHDSARAYSYKGINQQIRELADLLGLDSTRALQNARNLPPLPEGADAWFAVPSANAIASKYFPQIADPAERYTRSVELVISKIEERRRLMYYEKAAAILEAVRRREPRREHYDVRINRLLRQDRTARLMTRVERDQKAEILFIAAQLGERYLGMSVDRVRDSFTDDATGSNQCGLGALEIGAILLTHPYRLVSEDEPIIVCSGDDSSPADMGYNFSPIFNYSRRDGMEFNHIYVGRNFPNYGSATAFLPE